MRVMLWWLIPLGATLLAVLWVLWAGRERPGAEAKDSIRSYHMFREAMERSARERERAAGAGRPSPVDQHGPRDGAT